MSSSLTATKIKDTYGQLLHVDGGVTSTAKTVYDGDGTATALKVSTTDVQVNSSPVLTDADIGSTVQAYDSDLTAWSGKTAPSSTVVGTTDTQTLTNKTIELPSQTSISFAASSRPSIRPSLLLDFANTKQLDPRITFSRPTTATYYDGKTVVKAEENLLSYSQEFDNSYWSKANSTITANALTAPDGTSTADALIDDATLGLHTIGRSLTLNGGAATYSVYAKSGTANFLFMRASDGAAVRHAWFDVSTGVVGTVQPNVVASITAVGGGWYRCVATFSGSLSSASAMYFGVSTADNTSSYTGTGSTLYLWGTQAEQRSTATAYTPTTTAPITNYIPALQTAVSNDARFDHDPITGESKGLLIEEQRTNLLLASQEIDSASWSTKAACSVTANTAIAPDGTLTADKIVEDTTSAQRSVRQPATASPTVTQCLSAYLKSAGRSSIRFYMDNGGSTNGAVFADFNLVAQTASSVTAVNGATAGTAQIISVGNGWFRCSVSGIPSTTGTIVRCNIYFDNDSTGGGGGTYTGDGYSGMYLWGAQLEAGSFPTSYIPTVASQVTRSADSASMTGSNFSSWFRGDEGTFAATVVANNYAVTGAQIRRFIAVDDGSGYNRISFGRGASTAIRYSENANGVTYSSSPASAWAAYSIVYNQTDIAAFGYSSVSPSIVLNGALFNSNTAAYSHGSGFNALYIGNDTAFSSLGSLNGTIKRIAYYPARLSNTELQGLTS